MANPWLFSLDEVGLLGVCANDCRVDEGVVMTAPGGRGTGGISEFDGVLSERDQAVLADLARVRLLTGRLMQRLHLHDGSPLTQARRTRSLLQRLHAHGLITRLDRQIGGVRAGSSGFVYGLAAAGQRHLEAAGPAGGGRRRRPWEPSRLFVEHILAVAGVFVELRELERLGGLELVGFDAEPRCWRHWTGQGGERLVLKPDAHVVVGVGEFEHVWVVEVDRGTESRTVLARKAQTYVTYWQSGVEQRTHGLFPKVLWLTTTPQRAGVIVDVLARTDPAHWHLFQVGHIDQAGQLLSGRMPAPGG